MERSSSSEKKKKKLHIAMFPWLAYGHLMPFLEVSKFLAAEKGFKISYISTPKNIQSLLLKKHLLHPLIHFVELPLPRVTGLPDTAECTSELPSTKIPYLKKAYDKLEPSLVNFLRKTGDVDCIIHDILPHWMPRAAAQVGVPNGVFSIFVATSIAYIGPPDRLINETPTPEELTAVPNWITYPTTVAFRLYEVLNFDESMDDEVPDFVRFGSALSGAEFVIVRTCPEFESEPLSLLRTIYGRPVIPTGLLLPCLSVHRNEEEKWKALKEWLDKKKEKSVFYIALGSEISLKQEVMHELALGIEASNLPFVWAIRDNCLPLPSGFEERVSGKGFIWKGWAPQLDILAHPSVGGYLTHCGWASTIEALGLGRALILLSGGYSDQGLVARMLQEKGVGLEIERDHKDGSLSKEVVASTITRVMVEPIGEPVRAKAWAMRDIFSNKDLQDNYLHQLALSLTQILN